MRLGEKPDGRTTDVSVIIVSFNSASCIRECLESVRQQEGMRFERIVVDNASSDQTVDVVRKFDETVRIVANAENVGFGRGCNQGAALSRGEFVYFLNPDSRLGQGDALATLRRAMQTHAHWGMAATRVLSADGGNESEPATTYPGQSRARNEFDRLPGRIAWVIGASMFLRRGVFQALNGFDPEFFLYSEETDLCLRTRKLGYEIGHVREVTVHHIGGVSEQGRDPYDTWRRRMKGMHLFWEKHYAPEDVARLVQRDLRRAWLRMMLNGLLASFPPTKGRAWQKQRRYRAIRDESAGFLAGGKAPGGGDGLAAGKSL